MGLPTPERLGLPLGHVSIGDCAFAHKPVLLATVLGSCVSATFHHPGRKAGGMFHAMLPVQSMRRGPVSSRPCTFADKAVEAMLERFSEAGMPTGELVVKLFGGANLMFDRHGERVRDLLDVGRKNVESALAALARFGLAPVKSDVHGMLGRKLYFATATGEAWLGYLDAELTASVMEREAR